MRTRYCMKSCDLLSRGLHIHRPCLKDGSTDRLTHSQLLVHCVSEFVFYCRETTEAVSTNFRNERERLASKQAAMATGLEALLQTVSNSTLRNPAEAYFASAWNYMTDNYSRFTISVWISVILHEVTSLSISLSLFFHLSLSLSLSAGGVLRAVWTRIHRSVPAVHAEV